jgi:hypothetical protein
LLETIDPDSTSIFQTNWVGVVTVMPMTKDDLLATANEAALELRIPPVTRRALSNWIEDGFLERATPQGNRRGISPSWRYSDEARNTVTMIVSLKSLGAIRNSQLRVCLWVFGQTFEPELIKEALKSEFTRLVARDHRRRPWDYDCRNQNNLSEAEWGKYARQIPPIDSDLANAGFKLSSNILLPILSWIYWGIDAGENPLRTISDELSRITQLPSELFTELLAAINIGGAFGNPDETANSGQEILGRISEEDLTTARELIWIGYFGLFAGELLFGLISESKSEKTVYAFRKARESILTPEWITLSMGLLVMFAYNLRKAHNISG